MLNKSKINLLLSHADNSLILGQRLGEWCGHGPVLEQDIAMTNTSLDFIGRSRLFYQYAAELMNSGKSEDDLAFLRTEPEYKNLLLTEYPNTDFAYTVARQFFLDSYYVPFFEFLSKGKDERLQEIGEKSLKESHYHLRWSSEWVVRLGDGTIESKERIQNAINHLWQYTGEMFDYVDFEIELEKQNLIPSAESLKSYWDYSINSVFSDAMLQRPYDSWWQIGGKKGQHTEHLGFILSDLQFMQRVYPNLNW